MKIIELVGNDYYDKSNDHVILPEGMSLKFQKKSYDHWYGEEYLPQLRNKNKCPKYLTFFDWLIKNGAREPTKDELESFGG